MAIECTVCGNPNSTEQRCMECGRGIPGGAGPGAPKALGA